MFTVTHTHQDATWRTDARRDATGGTYPTVLGNRSSLDCEHRTEPSATTPFTNKVNFLAIAPTRRGAPPL